ncbi:unnamed protein product [Triticum turgidum subsp. durum]|uniref:Uncharacterized protein n=1 Tax=Triticum turgidum subsp. durum TaxID=4567 RepID=A0A9R0XSQ8_TRITD|nr:unnamed protein product [Triticum turgidum subsp. durum]
MLRLRLRECVVSRLLSPSSTYGPAISSLHRLLSASAAAGPISPNPGGFAVEDYLIDTCGLTRPQALKASTKLSHLKSPANPDAVLAFLAGVGLSGADKRSSHLLSSDLDKLVKPNVAFLRECGLGDCDIAKLCIAVPRMLITNPERVRAMVACAERLGVPRGSGMFRRALQAVAFLTEEKIAAKVDYLKNTFRWSDAQVRVAVCGAPFVLRKSKESLKRRSEFGYIAHRPVFLYYSLEGRIKPRCYVLKFLKENRLLDRDWSFYTAVTRPEKYFIKKCICPYKESAPHLAEDYAAACRGEMPSNFRFT